MRLCPNPNCELRIMDSPPLYIIFGNRPFPERGLCILTEPDFQQFQQPVIAFADSRNAALRIPCRSRAECLAFRRQAANLLRCALRENIPKNTDDFGRICKNSHSFIQDAQNPDEKSKPNWKGISPETLDFVTDL